MRGSVRRGFVPFTAPLEGIVRWMYLDVKGLVTTAIGILIDPIQTAMPLPWVRLDGSPAGRDEIAAEWMRVKGDASLARLGHRAAEHITNLRLTDEGVDLVVSGKLAQFDRQLAARFPEWEEWPADAQLATLSMSWACGPAFRFPQLEAALRARDFDGAAGTCHINEAGNPGIIPRNRANVALYHNAAKVLGFKLDPDALVWPSVLGDAASSAPPPGEAETGSGGIIHPLPFADDPDDID